MPSSSAFQVSSSLTAIRSSNHHHNHHAKTTFQTSSSTTSTNTRLQAQEKQQDVSSSSSHLSSSKQTSSSPPKSVILELTKPLGMILEEVIENQPRGVFVQQVVDTGSAFPYASQITGCKIRQVQGRDVTKMLFDNVMDTIVNAPDTLQIEFLIQDDETPMVPTLPIGTPVTLVYLTEQGNSQTIQAKVGDNLRQTLINNNIEVYQGLGQIMGNCGGAGQCKLCAMDFFDSEGWMERSDYEDKKLKRFPNARLSCLNSIQGPAKIQKTKQ